MFLCGSFCKNGFEQSNIQIAKVSHHSRLKSQLKQQTLHDVYSTFMFRKSKYDEFRDISQVTNQPFVDKEFPPNSSSLNYKIQGRQIVWKRIAEVVRNCVMVENDINPADIQQGNIGDCYFLASISAIAQEEARIKQIFHENFEISKQGIYRVIAVKQGIPYELIIDDYIPVFKGTDRPVFCRANGRQIWVMLLEKAWAKIKGSYGNISSGNPHEVLNTFSTAPCTYFFIDANQTNQYRSQLWDELIRSSQANMPVCAGTKNQNELLNGLRPSHTYTVLNCANVISGNLKTRILKLRNPWGETEYKGFASESDSAFWGKVPEDVRRAILPEKNDDGIFTIPYEEFLKHFESIDICNWVLGFNYEFKEISMNRNELYYVALEVKEQHEAYIGFEKQFEQSAKSPSGYINYGYSRLLIGKELDPEHYEYYTSKLQTSFPDINKYVLLRPGKYIIICDTDSPSLSNTFSVTFSYYYNSLSALQNKKLDYIGRVSPQKNQNCIDSIFLNHAFRLNDNKQKLGSRLNDWIASQLLYEQGGYGYLACNLQKSSSLKLQISINRQLIRQKGYILTGNHKEQMIIAAGQSRVFVFLVDFENKNIQNLQFPPPGFKLTKIA